MSAINHYQHILNGLPSELPVGKVVCIGRNYVAHARELNNPVPSEPILFIKPASAVVPLAQPLVIPSDRGDCHYETELSILIGERLTAASEAQCAAAIAGVGVALDLTLRDLQRQLKAQGQPWEKAKCFDGACPLSEFVDYRGDLQQLGIRLTLNGALKQVGSSAEMITPVLKLLAFVSQHFTLMPGDVVLTGTPAGVGPLRSGDRLSAELVAVLKVDTAVT